MTKQLVIANWKMNGNKAQNDLLLSKLVANLNDIEQTEIAICPPAIYLSQVSYFIENSKIKLGAQNVCTAEKGAFTGETSAHMLKDFNCEYVLVGHSERRTLFHESDQEIGEKILQIISCEQKPVLCIGESLEQRENGETNAVVIAQIQNVIDIVGLEKFKQVVIAYEPIWAIGTGKTASAEQAQEVHKAIREYLISLEASFAGCQILYGGSVNDSNAAELATQADINGFLVGGASLKADAFKEICLA